MAFRTPLKSHECLDQSILDTKCHCLRKYPKTMPGNELLCVLQCTKQCPSPLGRQSRRFYSATQRESSSFQLAYSSRIIPNRCILDCRVVRFMPSLAAAPCEPETIPADCRNTCTMYCRSSSSSVPCETMPPGQPAFRRSGPQRSTLVRPRAPASSA